MFEMIGEFAELEIFEASAANEVKDFKKGKYNKEMERDFSKADFYRNF